MTEAEVSGMWLLKEATGQGMQTPLETEKHKEASSSLEPAEGFTSWY